MSPSPANVVPVAAHELTAISGGRPYVYADEEQLHFLRPLRPGLSSLPTTPTMPALNVPPDPFTRPSKSYIE